MSQKLRCWKDDYAETEHFCETHGFSFGDFIEKGEKYSVFFLDVDGDEVECCLSVNHNNTSDIVNFEDIVFQIPLNELDLTTKVCEKLLEYCMKNGIIKDKN